MYLANHNFVSNLIFEDEETVGGKDLQRLKTGICDLEKSLSVIDIDSDGISKFLQEVEKKNSRTLSEV